jgi:hypothetical protein
MTTKEIDPDVELTRSMRPSGAPWLRGVALNVGLAAILLGGPWLRGKLRAEESVAAFGRLSACMTGGTPIEGGGLALPEGDRAAFARMVRSAEGDWPARCLIELDAVAQEDAMLLLPGPKEHESDVRAMVSLLRGELAAVAMSPDADVPAGVLTTLGRLQGTLTELADSASADVDVRAPAITLPEDGGLVASRLPVTVLPGSTDLRFGPDGIDVIAADPRRVAVLGVRGATVHEEHERRANGAHAMSVASDGTVSLLFTTTDEVCDLDAEHCAHHMTGIVGSDGTAVVEREAERWLGGHLVGRADRSVRVEGNTAHLIAATPDGGRTVLAFDWSESAVAPEAVDAGDDREADDGAETDAEVDDRPRHRASAELDLGRPRDALLHRSEVLWLDGRSLSRAPLPSSTPSSTMSSSTRTLELGGDAQHLWACGGFVVGASPQGFEVIAGERVITTETVSIRSPVDTASEGEEPLQLACDDEHLVLGVIRSGPTADVWACDLASCRRLQEGDRAVHGIDVAVEGERLWIAEWGGAGAQQVVVQRAQWGPLGGIALEDVGPMPPCWSDHAGFCAPAAFASDGEHLALYTRERSDVLLLALENGELAGLPGLR